VNTLVDTSYLFALINQNDRSHALCARFARMTTDHLLVPITILPEVAYLLDSRLGHHVMQQFVASMAQPTWTLIMVEQPDLQSAAATLQRYQDMRLDFVDATLVAVAERLGIKRILTLDRRHFHAVRPKHCAAFELLPPLEN
jgi:predicted nucleic acid-binding protein